MTAINPQAVRGPVTAVPVVAGKGVRLREDIENNRVVAEADETVLFNGTGNGNTITLSEAPTNFERIKVLYSSVEYISTLSSTTKDVGAGYMEFDPSTTTTLTLETVFVYDPTGSNTPSNVNHGMSTFYNVQSTTWNRIIYAWSDGWFQGGGTLHTDRHFVFVKKIIGINRVASN